MSYKKYFNHITPHCIIETRYNEKSLVQSQFTMTSHMCPESRPHRNKKSCTLKEVHDITHN
jgi:hypothetical protein